MLQLVDPVRRELLVDCGEHISNDRIDAVDVLLSLARHLLLGYLVSHLSFQYICRMRNHFSHLAQAELQVRHIAEPVAWV